MYQVAPTGQAADRDDLYSESAMEVGELANLEEYLNGNPGGESLPADLFPDLLDSDLDISQSFVPDNTYCADLSAAVCPILSMIP